ncbi:DUF2252 family protein, partial [Nocardia wallacei]|uniref:DUF2252 family protein n=1 Tax=Nocardia wallacei TaxID=480035 RepID=UPI00245693F2
RQFRNRKGAIEVTELKRDHLDDYGRLAGAMLARAHSRSIDPRVRRGRRAPPRPPPPPPPPPSDSGP